MAINTLYPRLNPTLMIDFLNSEFLDSRVSFSRNSIAYGFTNDNSVKSEENLVLYSEEFDNPAWSTTAGLFTITSNNETAPNNSLTADTLEATSSNSILSQLVNVISDTYTFSIYIKRLTGSGNIDLTLDSGSTWSTLAVSSSWQRLNVSQLLSIGTNQVGIRITTSGDSIAIWGAQLERRSTVTAYSKTTSTIVSNFLFKFKEFAIDEPRYVTNSFGNTSVGVLIESSSTNLNTYSEDFTNVNYVTTNISVDSNVLVSLNGAINADKLILNNIVGSDAFMLKQVTISAASEYTLSCYVKYSGTNYVFIGINNSATEYAVAQFDIQTKQLQTFAALGAGYSIVNTPTITSYDNNWCKISITFTSNVTINDLMLSPSTLLWDGIIRPGSSETGDGFNGVYAWGLQLESGKIASSYIPTSASIVTREADDYDLDIDNNTWAAVRNGTFKVSFFLNPTTDINTIISIDDNTTNNQLTYYVTTTEFKTKLITNSTTQIDYINSTNIILTAKNTLAAYYSLEQGLRVVVNGGNPSNANVLPYNQYTKLRLGRDLNGNYLNGILSNFTYYDIAINNNTYLKNLTL